MELETKERLIQEAHSRIEQYESRLIQMKQEIDLHKQTAENSLEQLQNLHSSVVANPETTQVYLFCGKGR